MPPGQPDDPGARVRARFTDLVRREAFDDAAVAELAETGRVAVPVLIEGSLLDDPRARRLSLRALALIPQRSVIATLLNAAETHREDPELVAICLRGAIAVLGPDDAPKVTDFFVARLDDEDPFVRAAAIDGLVRVHATGHRDRLLVLAADEHPFVAERAAAALGGGESSGRTTGEDALLAALASHDRDVQRRGLDQVLALDDPDAFITAHLGLDHRRIRRALTEAAIARESAGLYDALVARIEDPTVDDDERARVLRALRVDDARDDELHERRLDRFGRSTDLFVRAAAAVAAMSSSRRATLRVVERGLRDRDAHVRESIARAFESQADSVSGALLPAIIDEIRRLATEAQGPDDEAVAAALIRGLERAARAGLWMDDRAAAAVSPWIRAFGATTRESARSCYEALRTKGARSTDAEATTADQDLDSDDPVHVERALDRLEAADGAAVDAQIDRLLELLYRATPTWRIRIATLFGRSTDPRARRALERLAVSDDENVRDTARAALITAPPVASTAATDGHGSDGSTSTATMSTAVEATESSSPAASSLETPETPDAPLPPSQSRGEPWQ